MVSQEATGTALFARLTELTLGWQCHQWPCQEPFSGKKSEQVQVKMGPREGQVIPGIMRQRHREVGWQLEWCRGSLYNFK